MPATFTESFVAKHLEPTEILGEILFGLIMALTFTLGAGLVIQEGREAVGEMLVAILGCNVAWGIIDGGMFIMTRMFDRSLTARLVSAVRQAASDGQAAAILRGEFEPRFELITTASTRDLLYMDVLQHVRATEPAPVGLTRADIYGAIASFLLVFLSTVPAVIPFLIFGEMRFALRVSNGLLLSLLFLTGYGWARRTGARPWVAGCSMLLFGSVLVAIAMAFGG
jgi:hypothetical protein